MYRRRPQRALGAIQKRGEGLSGGLGREERGEKLGRERGSAAGGTREAIGGV